MAKKQNPENNPSTQGKGNPGDYGKSKASIKSVDPENVDEKEKVKKKHTEGHDKVGPDALKGSNPNRNTDKPDIDKPKY